MKYDLEERTTQFAKNILRLTKVLTQTEVNQVLIVQLVRSSNSTAANYLEANSALTKKDFIYRIGVSRKEARESMFHLDSLLVINESYKDTIMAYINEALELVKIFSAIFYIIVLKAKESIHTLIHCLLIIV